MRVTFLALVAVPLLLLAPGCLTPTSKTVTPEGGVPADPERTGDEFWMIWIHGRESQQRGPLDAQAVCSIVFDHQLNATAKRLVLSESYANVTKPRLAIAFDHFDDGDCPIAYEVRFDATHVVMEMGRAGQVVVDVKEDGTLVLDGANEMKPGQRLTVDYEGRDGWSGAYTVEHLGAWPASAISRA